MTCLGLRLELRISQVFSFDVRLSRILTKYISSNQIFLADEIEKIRVTFSLDYREGSLRK